MSASRHRGAFVIVVLMMSKFNFKYLVQGWQEGTVEVAFNKGTSSGRNLITLCIAFFIFSFLMTPINKEYLFLRE